MAKLKITRREVLTGVGGAGFAWACGAVADAVTKPDGGATADGGTDGNVQSASDLKARDLRALFSTSVTNIIFLNGELIVTGSAILSPAEEGNKIVVIPREGGPLRKYAASINSYIDGLAAKDGKLYAQISPLDRSTSTITRIESDQLTEIWKERPGGLTKSRLFAGPNNMAWRSQTGQLFTLRSNTFFEVDESKCDHVCVGKDALASYSLLPDANEVTLDSYVGRVFDTTGKVQEIGQAIPATCLLDDGIVHVRQIGKTSARFVRTERDGKNERPIFAGWEGFAEASAFDGTRLIWLTPGKGPASRYPQQYSNMWVGWPKEPERAPVKLLTGRKEVTQLAVDERGVAWVEMNSDDATTYTLYMADFI
jgi:hypothetical protein